MSLIPPLRPLPPLAKRLNRNALTVGAVLMGMTVLTAVVVVHPSREPQEKRSAPAASDEAPPVPSRPAFLDEPVRAPATRPDTTVAADLVPSDAERALAPQPSVGDTSAPYPAPSPTSAGASARERAYRAALLSAALLRAPDAPTGPSGHA